MFEYIQTSDNESSALPVSLTEVRSSLKIPTRDSETDLLTLLIRAAKKQFQDDSGKILLSESFELYQKYPLRYLHSYDAHIIIWIYPVTAISSVSVILDGETEYSALTEGTDYVVDITTFPGRIKFLNNFDLNKDVLNNMKVSFTAGETEISSDVKLMLLYLINHYYENPNMVISGTQINNVPQTYKFAILKYQRNKL